MSADDCSKGPLSDEDRELLKRLKRLRSERLSEGCSYLSERW